MSAREEIFECLMPWANRPAPGEAESANEMLDAFAAEVRMATLREVRKEAMALDKDPANDPYYWGYGGNEICKMIGAKVREARDGR